MRSRQALALAEIAVASLNAQLAAVTAERDHLQSRLAAGLRRHLGRTVVVHQNGPSLRGVLVSVGKDSIALGQATHLDAETDLGGEVVIPRAQGVFVQIPDSEAA